MSLSSIGVCPVKRSGRGALMTDVGFTGGGAGSGMGYCRLASKATKLSMTQWSTTSYGCRRKRARRIDRRDGGVLEAPQAPPN